MGYDLDPRNSASKPIEWTIGSAFLTMILARGRTKNSVEMESGTANDLNFTVGGNPGDNITC